MTYTHAHSAQLLVLAVCKKKTQKDRQRLASVKPGPLQLALLLLCKIVPRGRVKTAKVTAPPAQLPWLPDEEFWLGCTRPLCCFLLLLSCSFNSICVLSIKPRRQGLLFAPSPCAYTSPVCPFHGEIKNIDRDPWFSNGGGKKHRLMTPLLQLVFSPKQKLKLIPLKTHNFDLPFTQDG